MGAVPVHQRRTARGRVAVQRQLRAVQACPPPVLPVLKTNQPRFGAGLVTAVIPKCRRMQLLSNFELLLSNFYSQIAAPAPSPQCKTNPLPKPLLINTCLTFNMS